MLMLFHPSVRLVHFQASSREHLLKIGKLCVHPNQPTSIIAIAGHYFIASACVLRVCVWNNCISTTNIRSTHHNVIHPCVHISSFNRYAFGACVVFFLSKPGGRLDQRCANIVMLLLYVYAQFVHALWRSKMLTNTMWLAAARCTGFMM